MLPQQHGDIRSHIDIQVPCVDLQAIGAVYLGGATCQRGKNRRTSEAFTDFAENVQYFTVMINGWTKTWCCLKAMGLEA
jgi:hypothetical protein